MDNMKPKKKDPPSSRLRRVKRKSGYYIIQMQGGSIPMIGEYDPSGDYFELTGMDVKFPSSLFSYISPTPITIPKRKK